MFLADVLHEQKQPKLVARPAHYFFAAAFFTAQRFFEAATMLARPSALSLRFALFTGFGRLALLRVLAMPPEEARPAFAYSRISGSTMALARSNLVSTT